MACCREGSGPVSIMINPSLLSMMWWRPAVLTSVSIRFRSVFRVWIATFSRRPDPLACGAAMKRHLAVYTGSFDPITLGHLDVLARARGVFDELVLAIGHNPNKPALFSFEERLALAKGCVADMLAADPSGAPVRVETYSGLTVDFARSVGAVAAPWRRPLPGLWCSGTRPRPGSPVRWTR